MRFVKKVQEIVDRHNARCAQPLVDLARVLKKDLARLERNRITHRDHFLATLERALMVAQSPEDQLILGACALTHDLCPRKRLVSSTSDDELKRCVFRFYHMSDGSARGTDAISKTNCIELLRRAGPIHVINSLHDVGSARLYIELRPMELHKRFIAFSSLDTLGMLAWPEGGIDSGTIDGPKHSLWQKRDEKNGDVIRQLLENARSLKKRQQALLGLKSRRAPLIDYFSTKNLKRLAAEYIEEWTEYGAKLT